MRETVKSLLDEPRMLSFIGMFREGLWPGGELKLPDSPCTTEEKQRTRDEANRKLSSLIPGLFFCFSRKSYEA
jgi:sorting nexin-25